MARILPWKEKVALSALLSILLWFNTAAQTFSSKITYSCRAARLETVIDALARKTGYDFVYSRNIIDVSKPVTLQAKDNSIREVLLMIEEQTGLSFRIQDRHIIAKNNPKPAVVEQKEIARRDEKIPATPTQPLNSELLISSTSRMIPARPIQNETSTYILQNRLQRRIDELQSLLGPNTPKNIPPYYINQINFNNRHRGWFLAIGPSFGDKATGLEFQGGLKYLYGIVQPRWSQEQGIYGSYGVGTTINLRGNFAFNTIYMFTGRSASQDLSGYHGPYTQKGPEFQQSITERHHQLKLNVQYLFSKNLSFRAGPVLNYRTTKDQISVTRQNASYESAHSFYQVGVTSDNVVVVYENGQLISATKTTRRLDTWVGWDVTLLYRINFFQHK